MKLRRNLVFMLLLIVLSPGCATSPPRNLTAEERATRTELLELKQSYVDAWLAGDRAAVLEHFAEDAVLIPPPGEPRVAGVRGTQTYFWPQQRPAGNVTKFELKHDEVFAQERMAYIRGTFELEMNYSEDGMPWIYRNRGNYLMLLRHRRDQDWKIARFIWNDRKAKPVRQLPPSPLIGMSKELTGEQWVGVAHRVFGGEDADRRVEFDSPVPLDWVALTETLVPTGAVALSDEQEAELVRHTDDMSVLMPPERSFLEFEAPLPAVLRSRHYYFVSELGIQEVVPSVLRGQMLFRRPKGSDKWEKTGARGKIEGTIDDGKVPREGGVIIASSRPLEMSFQRLYEKAQANGVRFSRIFSNAGVRWTLYDSAAIREQMILAPSRYTDYASYRHASMLTIESTGQRYLFVSWKPVEQADGDCIWDFELFEVIQGQELNTLVRGANCSTLV